jgi:hypothetical protein
VGGAECVHEAVRALDEHPPAEAEWPGRLHALLLRHHYEHLAKGTLRRGEQVCLGALVFVVEFIYLFFSISILLLSSLTSRNVTGLKYKQLPDSPSIFVDTDGKGYIAFTHEGTR